MATCPACRGKETDLGEVLVMLFPKGAGEAPGVGVPMLAVRCNQCGYFRLFDAAMMGLA